MDIDESTETRILQEYLDLCDSLWSQFNRKSVDLFEQTGSKVGDDLFHDVLAQQQVSWFHSLSDAHRVVFAAQSFYLNWHLAFSNWYQLSDAIFAPEAADGFRAIQFEQTAGVIQRANAWFGSPFPRNQLDRMEKLGFDKTARRFPNGGPFHGRADPFAGLVEELKRALRTEVELMDHPEALLARYVQAHGAAHPNTTFTAPSPPASPP